MKTLPSLSTGRQLRPRPRGDRGALPPPWGATPAERPLRPRQVRGPPRASQAPTARPAPPHARSASTKLDSDVSAPLTHIRPRTRAAAGASSASLKLLRHRRRRCSSGSRPSPLQAAWGGEAQAPLAADPAPLPAAAARRRWRRGGAFYRPLNEAVSCVPLSRAAGAALAAADGARPRGRRCFRLLLHGRLAWVARVASRRVVVSAAGAAWCLVVERGGRHRRTRWL